MGKKWLVSVAGIMVLVFGYYFWQQSSATYVKPIAMSQEVEFLARGLGSSGVIGEIKRPVDGRAFTFVVKERQPSMKDWKTHYVGITESVDNWQPQAEKLGIFFDDAEQQIRFVTPTVSSVYTLDIPKAFAEVTSNRIGGFPEMNELPLNEFIPVMLYSKSAEIGSMMTDVAHYDYWESGGNSYDYVIGIEVRQDTTQW